MSEISSLFDDLRRYVDTVRLHGHDGIRELCSAVEDPLLRTNLLYAADAADFFDRQLDHIVDRIVALERRHNVDACVNAGWDDAPSWQVLCACGWEAWNQPTVESARDAHAEHRREAWENGWMRDE
jgi:hypothetical protein